MQIQSSRFPALSRYFFSSDFFSSSINSSNVSLSTFTLFDYSFISRLRVTSRQSLKRRKLLSPRSSRTSPILLDVNKMTELVPLLDALEEGVTLIGAENYSTGSTVLPFLVKFNKLLKKDETDPGYMMDFKKLLRNDLEEVQQELEQASSIKDSPH